MQVDLESLNERVVILEQFRNEMKRISSTHEELKTSLENIRQELASDKIEKLDALTACNNSVNAVASAIQDLRQELKNEHIVNVQRHSATNEHLATLWDTIGKTKAGKVGASVGMAGFGMFVLKLIEAGVAVASLLGK